MVCLPDSQRAFGQQRGLVKGAHLLKQRAQFAGDNRILYRSRACQAVRLHPLAHQFCQRQSMAQAGHLPLPFVAELIGPKCVHQCGIEQDRGQPLGLMRFR